MKRFWLGLFLLIILGLLSSCSGARVLMQQAPKKPGAMPTLPSMIAPLETRADLERHIYGPIPTLSDVTIKSTRIVGRDAFTPGDIVTEWAIEAGYGGITRPLHIVFVTHENNTNAPYILTQNFCPNSAVVPLEGITPPQSEFFDCSGGGVIGNIFGYFFGRYITVPPYEMISKRGYNLAIMFPSEFVPDSASRAPAIISALFAHKDEQSRHGTLGIWASLSIWLAEELKAQGLTQQTVPYGHSRYGKTALIAAAFSDTIDGAIAHQSGTGGASLLRDDKGESVAQVLENYPHWFSPDFSQYRDNEQALPVDAHNLLSLIAPRPILLGNARRDVWSDPAGAFDAARAATPAWAEKGSRGLSAKRLDDFIAQDDIAFWLRPGTHGVVKEDWPAFLDFMDAHFTPAP